MNKLIEFANKIWASKFKYGVIIAIAALILVMVFFGVSHDGFEGLNR